MKEIISCANAPAALGPYSHAVAIEGIVFTSGQLGVDPVSGKLAQGIEAQARQVFTNVKNVLQASGCTIADAVKTTVFLIDMADFSKVNAIYQEFFGPDFPARSCIQVGALPGGAQVECECIAFKAADEPFTF